MRGYEHRLGGLEKNADGSGNVSYRADDHAQMNFNRQEKIRKIQENIPLQKIKGVEAGDLLMVTWGGGFGACHEAVERLLKKGKKVAHIHLSYIQPLPANIAAILKNYKKIVVAELNNGQLLSYINGLFSCQAQGLQKVQGVPFTIAEIETAMEKHLEQL